MVEEKEKQFKYEFIIAAALCLVVTIFFAFDTYTRILIVPMILLLAFLIWKFFETRDKVQQKSWINYHIAKIKSRKEKQTEEKVLQEIQEHKPDS